MLADCSELVMPRIRITELLREIARDTSVLIAFTNLRIGRPSSNENAFRWSFNSRHASLHLPVNTERRIDREAYGTCKASFVKHTRDS